MKILEIITSLVVGAVVLTYIGYLLIRCLGNCRDNKDRIDREIDTTFNRHLSKKP